MSDRSTTQPEAGRTAHLPDSRMPLLMKLAVALAVAAGTVFVLLAAYYSYLAVNPPQPSPDGGDLYLGDGTGFVIAFFFVCPALASLTAGFQVLALWRRGSRANAKVLAVLSPLLWMGLPLYLALWWQ